MTVHCDATLPDRELLPVSLDAIGMRRQSSGVATRGRRPRQLTESNYW